MCFPRNSSSGCRCRAAAVVRGGQSGEARSSQQKQARMGKTCASTRGTLAPQRGRRTSGGRCWFRAAARLHPSGSASKLCSSGSSRRQETTCRALGGMRRPALHDVAERWLIPARAPLCGETCTGAQAGGLAAVLGGLSVCHVMLISRVCHPEQARTALVGGIRKMHGQARCSAGQSRTGGRGCCSEHAVPAAGQSDLPVYLTPKQPAVLGQTVPGGLAGLQQARLRTAERACTPLSVREERDQCRRRWSRLLGSTMPAACTARSRLPSTVEPSCRSRPCICSPAGPHLAFRGGCGWSLQHGRHALHWQRCARKERAVLSATCL